MINVLEAKRRMMDRLNPLGQEQLPLLDALGRYTARDITAPFDHPLFDSSAMDGYAFSFGAGPQWQVVGEVAAGEVFPRRLEHGESVRIFTGGMIPEGCDTVVAQERVLREGDMINHNDLKLRPGSNVRRRGEQLRAGETALKAGTLLDAPAIGLLASVGVSEVAAGKRPKVGLLVTGNEFLGGGEVLPGKIFGSNGVMLHAALVKHGLVPEMVQAGDDEKELKKAAEGLLGTCDAVITTGGVSVGAHDHVPGMVSALGGDVVFHGVRQKPGRPMLFAMLGNVPLFGLPGNPRAAMILFLEYVLPYLRAMQGAARPWPRHERLPIAATVTVKGHRAEFRAARVKSGQVELLADEGSHMLRSLAHANALAYIPAELRHLEREEHVEVHYVD